MASSLNFQCSVPNCPLCRFLANNPSWLWRETVRDASMWLRDFDQKMRAVVR